ncbi:hypothetical protein [Streptomyces sp. NPDC052042]|uniref:hypothetical protein n=1 Tax=Streptomyces sp. NPDC052042 TaxID=3365683 RepID=UPI0037D8ACC9
MTVACRPLLTATAAGALLTALWFVPSANATDERDGTVNRSTADVTDATDRAADAPAVSIASGTSVTSVAPETPGADAPVASDAPDSRGRPAAAAVLGASSSDTRLADTGSGVDTTPYLVGGTAFLGVGAAFVAYSVRRAGTPSL